MTDAAARADEARTPKANGSANIWRVVGAATGGSLLEWYEYFIYGTAAALLWDKLFFPTLHGVFGLLASYSTFAVGFAVRPIRGLLLFNLWALLGTTTII